jgi:hypothetical protein
MGIDGLGSLDQARQRQRFRQSVYTYSRRPKLRTRRRIGVAADRREHCVVTGVPAAWLLLDDRPELCPRERCAHDGASNLGSSNRDPGKWPSMPVGCMAPSLPPLPPECPGPLRRRAARALRGASLVGRAASPILPRQSQRRVVVPKCVRALARAARAGRSGRR